MSFLPFFLKFMTPARGINGGQTQVRRYVIEIVKTVLIGYAPIRRQKKTNTKPNSKIGKLPRANMVGIRMFQLGRRTLER